MYTKQGFTNFIVYIKQAEYKTNLFYILKKCVHEAKKKSKTVDKEFLTLNKKRQDFSTSSETGENVHLFVFISLFGICIYLQYFFDIERNQPSNKVQVYYIP